MTPSGTFRSDDGSPVPFKQALEAWAAAARGPLLSVARRYHLTISYKELAEAVQASAGIETTMLIMNWIGKVLERVAFDSKARGEPMLTALCVRADGTMGEGFRHAVEDIQGVTPEDLEMHAAEERLRCYQFFGANVPADGGRPELPARLRKAKSSRSRGSTGKRPSVCPTCHLQLPATGRCDTCDA